MYANRRMAALVGVGFASGLPYILAGDTLSAWLSDLQIDVKTIGLFSLIGLPYAVKFLWAPLLDRYSPPLLGWMGRRRGWLVLLQGLLAVSLACLGAFGPKATDDPLLAIAVIGTVLVLLSATQDIVADAYRTDVLQQHELGAGAAVFVAGYRLAMIVGGAFTLIVAGRIGWSAAYFMMAALMAGAVVVSFLAPRPLHDQIQPQSLIEAVVQPVRQFTARGISAVVFLLVFVLVFRMPDFLASRMTMPLLIKHLQFSPEEVGWIRQALGFFLTIIGALIGGGLIARIGLMRGLIVFGILQAASNGGFLLLTYAEPNLMLMAVVIGVESVCGGLVAAGFVAFLMSCCDRRYSATQYALLSACMAASMAIGGAITGYLVEHLGYSTFFLVTILSGIPGLAMLPWIRSSCQWTDASGPQDNDHSHPTTGN